MCSVDDLVVYLIDVSGYVGWHINGVYKKN